MKTNVKLSEKLSCLILVVLVGILPLNVFGQESINQRLNIYPPGMGNTHIPWTNGDVILTGYTGSESGNFIYRVYNGASYINLFRINSNGNVGIGVSNPGDRLSIAGRIRTNGSTVMNPDNSSALIYLDWLNSIARIRIGGTGVGSQNGLDIQTQGDKSLIRFLHNGNVGIGVTAPTSKLEVNGTIKTKEVNVTATGWADYVFKPEYKIMPLSELEAFIQKNGHLPDVPTEAEVMENGVNLAEMNVKLLEKVEELTLYLIEQSGQIKALKAELKSIKK